MGPVPAATSNTGGGGAVFSSASVVDVVDVEDSVDVSDVEGEPGWYRVSLNVRPHFKYMGADFTLSLVGKLDKE